MSSFSYVSCSTGQLPPKNAVKGGDDDGASYHARGYVDNIKVAGKVGVRSASDNHLVGACFPYGSKEHRLNNFEVLITDNPDAVSYVLCKTGDFPPENAVKGGDGPSYHAKGYVSGKTIPGKAGLELSSEGRRILKGACFPYGSREHRINTFEVLVEADVIKDVKFHVPRGKVLCVKPKVIAQQTLANETDAEQTMSFSVNEKVSSTSTFTHQYGVAVKTGAKFAAMVPLLAEAEISMEVSHSLSYSWGKTKTIEKQYTVTFPVKTTPHSTVRCTAKVTESEIEVPYTIHYKSGKTSSGMWNAVSHWNLEAEYKNV